MSWPPGRVALRLLPLLVEGDRGDRDIDAELAYASLMSGAKRASFWFSAA